MVIARYKELTGHPAFQFNVEIIVVTNGKRVRIAEFNCKDEKELKLATDRVDYLIKGEDDNV